jgi:amino acid adenylation domain-containing protein
MTNVAMSTAQPASAELPLTHSQRQLWLFQQVAPDSVAHHAGLTARIHGPLDIEALRRSLQATVRRHAALRTVFPLVEREVTGALVDHPALHLAVYDLEDADPTDRAHRTAEIRSGELRGRFDLEHGPMIRFGLVILDIDEYELIVAAHRLVVDDVSLAVFAQDLLDHYAAFAVRRRPEQPPPALQFPDHALRQGERAARVDLAYWRETLADLPDPLELPTAGARGAQPARDAQTATATIPADLAAQVRTLAEAERTDFDTVTLAAFVVLLHRYTQAHDIVLGTVRDGRDQPGAAEAIGPFAEPTVLRFHLPHDPTWRTALRIVRDGVAAAAAHADASFQQQLAAARPERHPNLHPVFQILVAAQVEAPPRRTVNGVTFEFERPDSGETLYDLELLVDERCARLRYQRELFDPDQADDLVARLVQQLGQLAGHADTHLSNLSLLGPAEQERILRAWNRTDTAYPRDRTIHSLFEAQAGSTPDAVALRWENGHSGAADTTYQDLDRRANQLAHFLRGLGVGTETRVGLYFGYNAQWVVGALATLKAGGLYVPLDPAYPPDRLAAMGTDADISVLLTDTDGGLEQLGVTRVRLDGGVAAAIAAQPVTPPEVAVDPDNLAYIMFTSGSTGRAKAIGVTHRNVVRTVRGTTYVDFKPTDIVGQASNISFDATTFEVWGALLNGARLVGLRKEDVLDPDRLAKQLRAHQLSVFFLPAALMKQIVSERPDAFGTLRYFFSGGEQADLHTLRRMLSHGPPGNLINPYGPTETTVFSIVYRCNDMPDTETYVPIGRPIDNTTAYILDTYLQPVPVGVAGELYHGGDCVARGYVAQSDLTAETFLADPFSDRPGARLYRTGDLARYRPDGMIDFLGRVDRQVKIRGFRVEPAEIEACLLSSGVLREVSVQVGTDRSGDQTLVAYLVPGGPDIDLQRLREFTRARLPAYMVPAAFVPLDSLPLNANGKLDTRALARLGSTGSGTDPAGVDPATPAEQGLAEIWREVLGVQRIRAGDDFFALGGDSLAAATVVARASTATGASLPYPLPFEHRTLADLAAAVDGLAPGGFGATAAGSGIASDPGTSTDPVRLTETGQQLLEIWREVLDAPDLGPDDDFFLSGGHSLKVTRVVSRVNAALGLQVPVGLLFENRTVTTFAAALADLAAGGPAQVEPELAAVPEGGLDINALLDQIEQAADETGTPHP